MITIAFKAGRTPGDEIEVGSVAERCLLLGGKTDILFQGRQDRF
jgi:hypothetical protein